MNNKEYSRLVSLHLWCFMFGVCFSAVWAASQVMLFGLVALLFFCVTGALIIRIGMMDVPMPDFKPIMLETENLEIKVLEAEQIETTG